MVNNTPTRIPKELSNMINDIQMEYMKRRIKPPKKIEILRRMQKIIKKEDIIQFDKFIKI